MRAALLGECENERLAHSPKRGRPFSITTYTGACGAVKAGAAGYGVLAAYGCKR